MIKVVESILDLIGHTPMLKLSKTSNEKWASVYLKMEGFNPLGSVKDRTCLAMIQRAEREGHLRPGDTLIEPTSGNTGIGLAYVSAYKGYKLVLAMPETMSVERRKILAAFGARIVLTEGSKGMKGAVDMARELAEKNGWHQLQQFENPANPQVHRETTAMEILEQVPDLDAFVAGVGTGGTLTGIGEVLKEKFNSRVQVYAVEPADSPVLSGGKPSSHQIQGLGAGFIPKVLNLKVIDDIIRVSNDNAFNTTRTLALKEGLFVGISSGAAVWAAKQVARKLGTGKKVVAIIADHGERYLSTSLFGDNDV